MAPEDRRKPGPLRKKARELDSRPGLVDALRTGRELLPGDHERVPSTGTETRPQELLARYLTEVSDRPSAARELGLGVVQLARALADTRGEAKGTVRLAIMFTDLVEFSAWALKAGDAHALELLRDVGRGVEPVIGSHGGRLVKRLGDGHMAVFRRAGDAVEASHEALERLRDVEVAGYRPLMRIGVHVGYPRKVRADYLGVDVNVAARVAAAAAGEQVLVSEAARTDLDPDAFDFRRVKGFRAKGTPADLEVYAVTPRPAA
jgi:adenylate cyclase